MERPEYKYPSYGITIPAGYVCITLEEYRDMIETNAVNKEEKKTRDAVFDTLQELMKSCVEKNDELQAQVDEFKAFLAKEPYAQTMLDGYREYMKRKQEAETSEGDAP